MSLLDRVRALPPGVRRFALATSFVALSGAVLALVVWPQPADVRLLWTAPDRLAALWSCSGRTGLPLLLVDALLALGVASFLLILIAERPPQAGASLSAAVAWFVVAACVVQLIRDAAVVAIGQLRPELAPSVLPFFGFVGWLVPALAAFFALASRRLSRGAAAAAAPAAPPAAGGAPATGGPRVFGIDLFGAGHLLLDSGTAMVVAAITFAVVATTFWSRSTFVIQRIVLPEGTAAEGLTEELAGSVFATELRRATDVGFSIHSQNVSVRELADVADWTLPGYQISLRSILSGFLRGERVTIAVAGGALHWNVFVATSSGIAIVVPEGISLSENLGVAARKLLTEECNGEPSEVLRPACALMQLKLGDQYLDAQLPSAAEAAFRRALELDNEAISSSLVYVSLGRLAGTRDANPRERLAGAESEFDRAQRCVATIPSVAARGRVLLRIHHHWGEANLYAGRTKEAREHFELAAAADPTSAYGYHDLGRVALSEGNWEGAERWFSEAIKADPSFSYSYCDRAEARGRQRLPQLERALEDFRIAARRDVLCGHLGAAAMLGRLDRADEAKAALRGFVESEEWLGVRNGDPKWIWAYKDLGDLAASSGDLADAARWYASAAKTEPRLEWRSAADRREVLIGVYDNWARVLDPKREREELAAVLEKRAGLEAAVAAGPPP